MTRMNMRWGAAVLLFSLLAACNVGPDYKRPDMKLPESWPASQDKAAHKASEAGGQWWHLYNDAVLNRLEDEALAHNADIQVAAARVQEVRAQLGVTESDQYPVLTANINETRTKYSQVGGFARSTQNLSHATLNASYEVDLWGKLRRASEAARANLLAAESSRETVRLSLTAQVAQQYFALLSLDAQEKAIRRVLAGRKDRLELSRQQLAVGVISEYDLHQVEADMDAAQSQLASISQARDKQETTLALLLGRSPRDVMNSKLERGKPALPAVSVPDGLPADLLLRRPDLQQAEQNLVALNADIGAVRANYFPSITLTSYAGSESVALANMFTEPAGIFQFAVGISQPIFNAGRLGYLQDEAKARRDQALIQYKQAVASAFGDVRNALSAQDAARQTLAAESRRSKALEQAYQQAELRYQTGVSSRLELLDVERNYLQAELNYLDAARAQRSAVADLFKALGGGWKSSVSASK